MAITNETFKEVRLEIGVDAGKVPAGLRRLLLNEDFVTVELARAALKALMQGVFPTRAPGGISKLDSDKYREDCLSILRRLSNQVAAGEGAPETAAGPAPRIEAVATPNQGVQGVTIADQRSAASRPLPKQPRAPRSFPAPEGMARLTLNMPLEMRKRLKLAAVERDKTMTDIIMEAVERFLG